ncbi:hypothetical protein JKP88DRAFT_353792 [Tribonema minus]|uniref:Uncharacterized protein n=1 Tax=Tribonema minus TaxID=303371 RepID=A0A835Z4I4_9STRA|nr:hypothetical protein JKP88DRAFT_353792 [Tribonema minus]
MGRPPQQQQWYPGPHLPPAMPQQVQGPTGQIEPEKLFVTVYVGKLADAVEPQYVGEVLRSVGRLAKWNRANDAETNKLKHFGFATYRTAEEADVAVKVLNGQKVMGEELLVKVGKKEQAAIDEFFAKKSPYQLTSHQTRVADARKRILEPYQLTSHQTRVADARKRFEAVVAAREGPKVKLEEAAASGGDGAAAAAEAEASGVQPKAEATDAGKSAPAAADAAAAAKGAEGGAVKGEGDVLVPPPLRRDENGEPEQGMTEEKAAYAFSEAIKFRRLQEERDRRDEEQRRQELQRRLKASHRAQVEKQRAEEEAKARALKEEAEALKAAAKKAALAAEKAEQEAAAAAAAGDETATAGDGAAARDKGGEREGSADGGGDASRRRSSRKRSREGRRHSRSRSRSRSRGSRRRRSGGDRERSRERSREGDRRRSSDRDRDRDRRDRDRDRDSERDGGRRRDRDGRGGREGSPPGGGRRRTSGARRGARKSAAIAEQHKCDEEERKTRQRMAVLAALGDDEDEPPSAAAATTTRLSSSGGGEEERADWTASIAAAAAERAAAAAAARHEAAKIAAAAAAAEAEAAEAAVRVEESRKRPAGAGSGLGFSLAAKAAKRGSGSSVAGMFGLEGEEERAPSRPVVPIDYDDGGAAAAAPGGGRKDRDKVLVDMIPKDKDALFAYPLDWGVVTSHGIVANKMRPWVVRKIREYLGEEEPTLIDFVCAKLEARAPPQAVLDELRLVLEEDAEVFTVKMWRMLVFCALRAAAAPQPAQLLAVGGDRPFLTAVHAVAQATRVLVYAAIKSLISKGLPKTDTRDTAATVRERFALTLSIWAVMTPMQELTQPTTVKSTAAEIMGFRKGSGILSATALGAAVALFDEWESVWGRLAIVPLSAAVRACAYRPYPGIPYADKDHKRNRLLGGLYGWYFAYYCWFVKGSLRPVIEVYSAFGGFGILYLGIRAWTNARCTSGGDVVAVAF